MVREFYANLAEMRNENIFVRGVRVMLTSETINKLVEAPDHEEENYSVLMEEGVDTKELEKKLCENNKEVICVTRKNNQPLTFNAKALLLRWTPLFKLICNRLIPATHTSHVTLDCAILLFAMVEKMRVDACGLFRITSSTPFGQPRDFGFQQSSLSFAQT